MASINRMLDPVVPDSVEDLKLADVEVLECPYPTYDLMIREAPVWHDPVTGMYIVTRYEDCRAIVRDTETYSNWRPTNDWDNLQGVARKAYLRFKEKGWVPGVSLAGRDDPNHKEMRAMFDEAFTASRIRELDPVVETLAYDLIDGWIDDGKCEIFWQYAVPLPLIIICQQMGARDEDIWKIKEWTDAWMKGIGFGLTEDELMWCIDKEIESQHYFKPIFDRLRQEPDGTLLSELVNRVIPEWGRTLTDNELMAEMMQDTFVGGSETTTNAITSGFMLLGLNRPVWEKLKSDPDQYLRTFCEEVVRLEAPAQGMSRRVMKDVELHGVEIPKGSILHMRFAAANRDPEKFECPHEVDLERKNAAQHLGFSSGVHHCLGAPLARRELYWAFKAFIDRIEDFRLTEDNDLRHQPNFGLRIKTKLNIEFEPKKRD